MQRLDEIQSYVLLRRWQTENKGEILALQLTAAQLESLMDFYTNERSYIAVCQRLLILLSQSKAAVESRLLIWTVQFGNKHLTLLCPSTNQSIVNGRPKDMTETGHCAGSDGSEGTRVCQSALEGLQNAGLQKNLLQAAVHNLSPKSASAQQTQAGTYSGQSPSPTMDGSLTI